MKSHVQAVNLNIFMQIKQKIKTGFSLLEVLIFVSILSLFFITAISVSIYTLRDMRVSQERIFASTYGTELVEWFKAERDTDWNTFYSNAQSFNGGCKEFNTVNTISWTNLPLCTGNSIGSINEIYPFVRKVTIPTPAVGSVTIQISVEWTEGKNTYTVPINTVFTE